MKKDNQKLLYSGTSLEIFLRLKNQLEQLQIEYTVSEKKNDNWLNFLLQLVVIGTGSRGMNREREIHYSIYVSPEDYDKASALLTSK